MTPKEKAKQLVEKMIIYHSPDDKDYEAAKDCALIAVDEMLKYFSKETFMMAYPEIAISEVNYWQEVKQEIENL